MNTAKFCNQDRRTNFRKIDFKSEPFPPFQILLKTYISFGINSNVFP